MGRKAGSKILKRSMAPNFWGLAKKQKRFVTRTRSGPHNMKSSIPLTVLLRDILHVTKTYHESKFFITRILSLIQFIRLGLTIKTISGVDEFVVVEVIVKVVWYAHIKFSFRTPCSFSACK